MLRRTALSSALLTKGFVDPDPAGQPSFQAGAPSCAQSAASVQSMASVQSVAGVQSMAGVHATTGVQFAADAEAPSGAQPGDARIRPPPTECGALPFLIKRDGTWLYRGSVIGRKELVCLFSSVVRRDAAGDYWLETPVERGRIQVEETPWVAVELNWGCCGQGPGQCLTFRTNVDQVVTAGPDHPIRVVHNPLTSEPTPYIMIRPGNAQGDGPPLEARIGRAVYYELVALAVPGCNNGKKCLGVWSSNVFFPLGDLPACGG
jgi:hypothetical protein